MAEVSSYSGSGRTRRAPGVYIQEVSAESRSGVRDRRAAIHGFRCRFAALIGRSGNESAPLLRLTSWEQFEQSIGPMAPGVSWTMRCADFSRTAEQRCVVVPLRLRGSAEVMESELRLDEAQLAKTKVKVAGPC